MMSYDEAISFLYNSLPVYQHIGAGAYKPGLGTAMKLDEIFGHPHRRYKTIHIAGTNGKGSTAHTLASILQAAGYNVGLYTSPHIFDFRERIRVDGVKIPKEAVTKFVENWKEISESMPQLQPSFFELTSTLAFEYFAHEKVDVAVIETGLGGRLDSTNIISPVLSVITNISLDHTALLGDTVAAIAGEKAGIIKHKVPVVVGEWTDESLPVFRAKAEAEKAELLLAQKLDWSMEEDFNVYPSTPFGRIEGELRGAQQALNAATILKAVEALGEHFDIPARAVREGFRSVVESTGLFGRWSQIADSPVTIADTGHNIGGWERIAQTHAEAKPKNLQIVMGFVADKDVTHILELVKKMEPWPRLWFSQPSVERGMKAATLAAHAAEQGLEGTVVPDVNQALTEAREAAGEDGFVLVAGSNFLLADLKLQS